MEALVQYAEQMGCYKIHLDCSDKNVPFYKACGFQTSGVQMATYLKKQSKL